MKKFNIIGLLLAFVGVLSLASCEHQYADYTPGEKDKGMGVYFPNTAGFQIAATDTSVDIVVARIDADAAASVSLRAEAKNAAGKSSDLFTLPSKVDFAAGATETALTISFDGSKLVVGEKYSVAVKLDEEQASKYAISETTFSIMIPEPWVSAGQGIYFEDLLADLFGEPDSFRGVGAYVEFEQNELDPNRIRVKNAYAQQTLGAMWGGVPTWLTFTATGDTYIEFDITDPNNVIAGDVLTFQDNAGNEMKACAYPLYISYAISGTVYDLYALVWEDTPIVLQEGVIKFPQGAVELAAFYGGAYQGYLYYGNPSGYMQFYLPGTEFVNYEMQAAYNGMNVSADGATAKAIFNFALGGDVAGYKFAFVSGDITADPSATAEAIVAGSEELTIFESDAATKSWEVELTKGIWTLVAVPYTAEGEARLQDTYALYFYFNGAGEMPEVNLDVKVGAPASFVVEEEKAAIEAETPACYWLGINVTADAAQVRSMRAWWGTTATYKSLIEKGYTDDAILAEFGADFAQFLPKLAENGTVTARVNVNNGYEYTVLFHTETIYCTSYTKTFTYTMPKYDGTLAVGQYKFTDGEGDKAKSLNFSVTPGKSYKDFYFTHDDVDGSSWYLTYDEAAGTLTNSGIEVGYESYGAQWGYVYGALNKEATQVYSYWSSTTEDFAEMAPMVVTVENGALKALQTYFAMVVLAYDPENKTIGDVLGTYFNYTPATVIAPVVAEEEAKPAKAAKAASVESCVINDVIAAAKSEVVVNATPVAKTFNQAQLTLKR